MPNSSSALVDGDRIAVIDDSPEAGKAIGYTIRDAGFEPVLLSPMRTMEDLFARVSGTTRAAVCDHRLGQRGPIPYSGAEFVATGNQRGFPTVLITSYADADATKIRRWRSGIPCLLRRHGDGDDPDKLREALVVAENETRGELLPSRKAYRTVVRVESIISSPDGNLAEVVVSSWRPNEVVRVPLELIRQYVGVIPEITRPVRYMAEVNIYAGSASELFFRHIQRAAEPPEEWLN